MWRVLHKPINIHYGASSIWIWNHNVVYVAKNIDHYITIGADIAPIIFISSPHSNTEMNPTTLVDVAPHSKQNKSWSRLCITLIIVLIIVKYLIYK